jgi:hypothetical protein
MVNTHRIDIRLGARLIQTRVLPALLLAAAAASQAQTPPRASAAPLAPGVSRAVEHPDTSPPDSTVDQTLPDEHQPETAVDHEAGGPETAADPERGGPETARDDQKLTPETASDAPKPSKRREADKLAKQGIRSNTPPPAKPQS